MLSDVMEHFGLRKSLRQANFFETDHHRQLLKDLNAAIYEGGIVAITGMVGSGKTLLLWRIQDQLRQEGQIEVAESLVFDVPRVTLNTLSWRCITIWPRTKTGTSRANRKRVSGPS
jgi:type II secretory pathway predicted ATPase ExeA